MRYHALLYFDTEINLGLGTHPDNWINHKTIEYDDGRKAFSDYVHELNHSPSQVFLISGDNLIELEEMKEKTIQNFNDPAWREKLFNNVLD